MKNLFRGYYKLSSEDIKKIWENGFIENIFAKIDKCEQHANAILRVWKQLSANRFQNKVTNKKLFRIDFVKHQDAVGASAFIVEVMH
jgi:c-di-AMP phosphodiesterase-like protein